MPVGRCAGGGVEEYARILSVLALALLVLAAGCAGSAEQHRVPGRAEKVEGPGKFPPVTTVQPSPQDLSTPLPLPPPP